MLAKKYRFKNFNFKLFFKGEKRISDYFLVYKLKNNNNQKKFAVVVKNNLTKKVVEKNKIKRQIYEIIRTNLTKIKTGYYLIIPLKKLKYHNFKEELLKIIN